MALRHCGSCRILFVFIRLYQLDHSQCPLRPVQTSLQVCCNLPNSRQMIAENWKSFTAILQQIANILNEPKIFSYLFFLYSSNILRQSRSPEKTEMSTLLASFVLPNKQDFEFGASYGLITLQHFHDFDIRTLADGERSK